MAMAEKKNEYPPGVEADRRLLPFETWEDYLDSLIEIADLRNLRSIASARIIAALGYRATGDTLSEKEFYARRAVIHNIVYPVIRPYVLVSEGADLEDPFKREMAIRERANRIGILQPLMDPDDGLLFQNRHDHKIIFPNPEQNPGQNTTKKRVYSPMYIQVEIYDHVVRKKT
ncbi:unnamed protein product [Parnassius apollo]|uniref:Cilia- and flagella-associated protein 299 n=1 Tax=Parnassius apollo TaxID=110799 RepID=A0A8S3XC78_PARAO|nr:unnamed protein product [Parnassius apollo]